MPGILTITFSPCIDKSFSVPLLVPEKKLKCSAPKREPGGGGVNVARAIKKLGGEATAVYPAGGHTGNLFNQLMADEGVPSFSTEMENETRENIIILEESSNRQYRFGMPGTGLKEKEWQQILKRVDEIKDVRFMVASGSLPPGVPPDIFTRLAAIASKKKARFIADTSGEALKHTAREAVYLIKPNLAELSSLAGNAYLEPHKVILTAQQIIREGKCEVVVVSMGSEGALMVTKNIIKKFIPPSVKRKSTVGAGDSMVAGIVWNLAKGNSLENAVRYGVACGTAATLNFGTELCRLEDAERLYESMNQDED